MDKDFIYRQTLVWLSVERDDCNIAYMSKDIKGLAESLTNHLWNNWQLVERAKHDIHRHPENEGDFTMFRLQPLAILTRIGYIASYGGDKNYGTD